ncbi:hypothetical protein BB560_003822, partial [Smittium megazygosporum]
MDSESTLTTQNKDNTNSIILEKNAEPKYDDQSNHRSKAPDPYLGEIKLQSNLPDVPPSNENCTFTDLYALAETAEMEYKNKIPEEDTCSPTSASVLKDCRLESKNCNTDNDSTHSLCEINNSDLPNSKNNSLDKSVHYSNLNVANSRTSAVSKTLPKQDIRDTRERKKLVLKSAFSHKIHKLQQKRDLNKNEFTKIIYG